MKLSNSSRRMTLTNRAIASFLLLFSLRFNCVSSFSAVSHQAQDLTTTRLAWSKGGRRYTTNTQLWASIPADGQKQIINGQHNNDDDNHTEKKHGFTSLPRQVFKMYTEYAGRLWNETNIDAPGRVANDKILRAIRQIEEIAKSSRRVEIPEHVSPESLKRLEDACDTMLHAIRDNRTIILPPTNSVPVEEQIDAQKRQIESSFQEDTASVNGQVATIAKKKPRRSIMFGAAMGLVAAAWVFSGNYIFTALFTLTTILGQLEYYRMVMKTGVYPARRLTIVGGCSMFLTALFTPDLHQICLPVFGLWAMIGFLATRRSASTIPEIATTFTGMFYLGYVPSFWVRIRLIGANREPTRLAPLVKPVLNFLQQKAETTLPSWIPQAVHLPITTGAIFIFWTWLALAFSDVGAYFVGKNFGKTKLGTISPAAGATSPNKSVEGVIGGCLVSGALGVIGAWVQRWPYFFWTGAIHGIMLGLLGLIGDLTASMLKRDAGLKDFGDLLPEHGGIMDRVDSFIWTAPYSWIVCAYIIPALRKVAG